MTEQQATGKFFAKNSVRTKLLSSIAPVVLLLIIVTVAISTYNDWQTLRVEELKKLEFLEKNYQTVVLNQEKAAGLLAVSFADRDDIRKLFESNDREGLLKLLSPVFATLKETYNIVHLYIEDSQGRVFLRVHNPKSFGDDISYRRTVAAAMRTRKPVAGIEIGPSRLGIRGVAPIEEKGRFVGMAEVGIDYDQAFLDSLKASTQADYTMWVSYDAAQPAGLKPTEDAPAAPSARLFYYAGTAKNLLPIDKAVYERVLASGQAEVQYLNTAEGPWVVYIAPMEGYGNNIIGIFEITISRSQVINDIIKDTISASMVALIIGILSMAIIWIIAQWIIIQPIESLSANSEQLMAGKSGVRIELKSNDEFQHLGETINQLNSRLQETILNLETRVAERTRELEDNISQTSRRAERLQTISELSHTIATIPNLDHMLKTICQLVSERFGHYHTGIFLLDENKEYAVFRASSSEGGKKMLARGHRLKVGSEGIVGYVTAHGRARIALDVGEDATYFNNPDLPATHSEVALPLIANDRIIGALDVQSEDSAAFTAEDVNILNTLSNQIAVAIENARLYDEAQKALSEVERRFSSYTESSWKIFSSAIPIKGYRSSADGMHPIYDANEKAIATRAQKIVEMPIKLRGTTIGMMGIKTRGDETINEAQMNIIQAASERMALAMETARLFSEARKRADRERTISEVSTKIGSSTAVEEIMRATVSELQKILGVPEVFLEIKDEDEE